MRNKSLFSPCFYALKSTNSFKNNHVTDVTVQFWLRLHENPFKNNHVTDVTDVTAKKRLLDIAFGALGGWLREPAQLKELAPQSSYDAKAILRVLKARGFFVGDTSKQLRVPTFSTQIKVWEVSGSVLNAE